MVFSNRVANMHVKTHSAVYMEGPHLTLEQNIYRQKKGL